MPVIERVKNWYRGRYVPPPRNDPDSPVVIFSLGHYEQPPVARLLAVIGKFWLDHWQWIIGTVIAIAAIVTAL